MVGRESIEKALAEALATVRGAEADIVAVDTEIRLARFSNNEIHQNSVLSDTDFTVRVARGQKVGMIKTNRVSELKDAVRKAYDVAGLLPDSPIFAGLPEPAEYRKVNAFSKDTGDFSPYQMADAAHEAIKRAEAAKVTAGGTVRTSILGTQVMSTKGVKAYNLSSTAQYKVVAMSDAWGTGLSNGAAVSVKDIDFGAVAAIAVDKCLRSADPEPLEAGEYEAVLEPNAVSTMLNVLAMCGIDGMMYHEGNSFATGRMGRLVTNPMVSIADDGLAPDTVQMPFDYEGVPRRKVEIIRSGVMSGMLFDSSSAKLEGTESTGHAMMPGAKFADQAMHLRLAPGDSDVESMIRATKKGILITRFHYVNPIHRVKTMFTGMTKDGTFLIENGKVTKPLRNLRFTDSILDGVLKNVELIGRKTELFSTDVTLPEGYVVPAIKTDKFNFTGSTDH